MTPEKPRAMWVLAAGACAQACLFCHERSQETGEFLVRARLSPEAFAARLAEYGAPLDRVLLEGGEPTLHPELPALVAAARRAGVRHVGIVTNGSRLARPGLLAGLLDAGLDTVVFSIHGGSAAVHDRLTRTPGSFERLLESLALACGPASGGPLRVMTHTVLNKLNAAGVPELLRRLAPFKAVRTIGLSTMFLNGSARRHAPRLLAPLATLARGVRQGLSALAPADRERVTVAGLPACLLGEFPERAIRYETEAMLGPEGILIGSVQGVQGPPCADCARNAGCGGVWREYARRYGWKGLAPLALRVPQAHADPRLSKALKAVVSLPRPAGLTAVLPDALARDLRRGPAPKGLDWAGYSEASAESLTGPACLLVYAGAIDLIEPALLKRALLLWTPLFAKSGYVLFHKGGAREPGLPAAGAGFDIPLWFMAKLRLLARSRGVYAVDPAPGSPTLRCRVAAADLAAIEDARNVYFWHELRLPAEATVVDLGAHVGGFAVPMAARLRGGLLLALEPEPAAFRLLQENLAPFGSRARARPWAVSAALSLEALLEGEGLARVDLLKVSVEEPEAEVLAACPELLRARVDRLVVRTASGRAARLESYLAGLGFSVRVEPGGRRDALWAWKGEAPFGRRSHPKARRPDQVFQA